RDRGQQEATQGYGNAAPAGESPPEDDHLSDLVDAQRQLAELPQALILAFVQPAIAPDELLAQQQLAGRASSKGQTPHPGKSKEQLQQGWLATGRRSLLAAIRRALLRSGKRRRS